MIGQCASSFYNTASTTFTIFDTFTFCFVFNNKILQTSNSLSKNFSQSWKADDFIPSIFTEIILVLNYMQKLIQNFNQLLNNVRLIL